jgi:hypothetical protein
MQRSLLEFFDKEPKGNSLFINTIPVDFAPGHRSEPAVPQSRQMVLMPHAAANQSGTTLDSEKSLQDTKEWWVFPQCLSLL